MTCDVCGGAVAHECIGASRCATHCRAPQRHSLEPIRPPVPPVRVPMRQVPPERWGLLPQSPQRALADAQAAGWRTTCTESCGPLVGVDGDVLEEACWSLAVHAVGGGRYLRMLWVLRKTWGFEIAQLLIPPTRLAGHKAAMTILKEGPR